MKKGRLLLLLLAMAALVAGPGRDAIAQAQLKTKPAVQQSRAKVSAAKASKLPDLIVSDIRLIKDCKIEITIKNIGTAGVPASGYHMSKGAGIQMYKGGKPWGGIRLGAIDPAGRLKTPGTAVKHVWFPGAANLNLGAGLHSIKVIVDNNNAVKELNEKNNSKTVRRSCQKKAAAQKVKAASGTSRAGTAAGVKQTASAKVSGAALAAGGRRQSAMGKHSADRIRLVTPDLVVSNFTVNQGAVQQTSNAFDFPFSVRIQNVGTGDVQNAFDLSFQTYSSAHQWSGQNQPGFNCKRVNRLLQKGQSAFLTGTLRILNYDISDQDLRVRAYVDSACSDEFPNQWGQVAESNENNNHSNEVTLSGGYHPHIGSLTPNKAVRGAGEVLMLGGMGFGSSQGSHTVMLRKGTSKIAAHVTAWHNGVIYFTVPVGAAIGLNKVSIADAATLAKCPTSNEVDLQVLNKKTLAWSNLIATWDLFKNAFKLELNTKGSGHSYLNTSKLTLLQTTNIYVPKIEFDLALLKYRFLINHMDSLPGGIVLTKQGCNANQLKMEVAFESNGVEVKTYNRALGPGGIWCDGCVADVHINNGKMTVIFTFSANGGNLDFGLSTNFSASVNASNGFADALMNAFLGDWNQDVRNQINKGVKDGLLASGNKNYILSEFTKLIKLLLGIGNKTITDIAFNNSGIEVTYTNP